MVPLLVQLCCEFCKESLCIETLAIPRWETLGIPEENRLMGQVIYQEVWDGTVGLEFRETFNINEMPTHGLIGRCNYGGARGMLYTPRMG